MSFYRSGRALAPLLATLLASVAACSSSPPPSPPPSPAAASTPPSASAVTVLSSSLHPFAKAQDDAGPVDPAMPLEGMSLLFQMTPQQATRAKLTLADLQDPTSPTYRRWLTPAAYAAAFGASPADVARASAWLASQGFTVHGPSATSTRLLFSGTAGQVEQAFGAPLHYFMVQGVRHFALASAPSIPSSLSSLVMGLRGVHDFRLQPASPVRPGPDYISDAGYPNAGERVSLAPSDFATIYDLNGLYSAGITGAGQKLAIVGEGDFNDADIRAFRTDFGLDTSNLPAHVIVPLSGANYHDPNTMGEATLDLEWSGGVARDVILTYVYTGKNPAYGVFDAMLYAIEAGTYPIISASYAGCEYGQTESEQIFLASMGDAAAMEGVTVLAASGDWGASGCDTSSSETAARYGLSVAWPAAIPSFIGVGGTEFNWGDPVPEAALTPPIVKASPFADFWSCNLPAETCAAVSYVPETGWNELAWERQSLHYWWGAGGGGQSVVYPKPVWQQGVAVGGITRQVPDVALSAAWSQVGYEISSSWTAADGDAGVAYPETLSRSGGTSAATPSFAGILALVNQAIAAKNPGLPVGLGNANPVLYALQASTKGGAHPVFHDIATGDNIVPCKEGTPDCPTTAPFQYGYTASAGYDMVTGLGSVDVGNLVGAWSSLDATSTALTVKAKGTTEGSPVTVTAKVGSASKANAMTGSVLFYADTVDDAGIADLSLVATAPVSASVSGSGHEQATATATIVVPPGLFGKASVVAFYSGDGDYLASWSAAQKVQATSKFAIAQTSLTLQPNEVVTLTTTGGVSPVEWQTSSDSTCVNGYYPCSDVESVTASDAAFKAGPVDGDVTVIAIDGDGAEARLVVLVRGPTFDGGTRLPPPWDGGPTSDGGETEGGLSDGGHGDGGGTEGGVTDGGHADANDEGGKTHDSGAEDSGMTSDANPGSDASTASDSGLKGGDASAALDGALASDALVGGDADDEGGLGAGPTPSGGGCGCTTAGQETAGFPGGLAAALALGAAFAARRKRQAR